MNEKSKIQGQEVTKYYTDNIIIYILEILVFLAFEKI